MNTMELTAGRADIADSEPLEADADRAFGFWIYLMSDAVIFALLFATYAVMYRNYAGGPTGQALFASATRSPKPCCYCAAVSDTALSRWQWRGRDACKPSSGSVWRFCSDSGLS
jgi:hypothetical protein